MKKLRVLCIEDNDKKYAAIQSNLRNRFLQTEWELSFFQASSYEESLKVLDEMYFDVALVDILLPSMDGSIDARAAQILVNKIENGEAASRPMMIGLTAVQSAYDEHESFFSRRLLGLEIFSFETTLWADNIALIIERTINHLDSFQSFNEASPKIDLLIVTARFSSEFKPILRKVNWQHKSGERQDVSGSVSVRGIAKVGGKELDTVLACQMQMGLSSTAAIVTQLL